MNIYIYIYILIYLFIYKLHKHLGGLEPKISSSIPLWEEEVWFELRLIGHQKLCSTSAFRDSGAGAGAAGLGN